MGPMNFVTNFPFFIFLHASLKIMTFATWFILFKRRKKFPSTIRSVMLICEMTYMV